jgi:3-hydroxy-9,10-secoandrosta-1,3,5(10)-triene-9,17-dione monooxygenase reductase component
MEALKEFMRRVPQCVTVVTSYKDGEPHGMTVSSFTSVSANPPLVMVALERNTRTCRVVSETGFYAVNLLSHLQMEVSENFAYTPHDTRFEKVAYRVEGGRFPVIDGVLAVLFCRVVKQVEAGDHVLYIGEVMGSETYMDDKPLVYLNRRYWTVKELA